MAGGARESTAAGDVRRAADRGRRHRAASTPPA